jgi:hypothetical protein
VSSNTDSDQQGEHCPLCDADLQGAPIPEKDRDFYGGHTHFSRMIGNYDTFFDRSVSWSCPDCGGTWKR